MSRAERFAQYAERVTDASAEAHERTVEVVMAHGTRTATRRDFDSITVREAQQHTRALTEAAL